VYGPHSRTDAEKLPKELNVKWGHVIADEAHRAKTPTSKQTRALWGASEDAAYRIAMTGTPIGNHIGDMWPILRFIAPDEWTSKTQYLERWVETEFNIWGGMEVHGLQPSHRDEYYSVVDPRMRRLPKELILPNLPPKTYIERFTEMSPKQAKAYKEMSVHLLAQLDGEGLATADNPLVKAKWMMQFASAYAEYDLPTKTTTLLDPSCKVDELMLILEELEGEKVAVFGMHKQLINLAAARLDRHNAAAAKADEPQHIYRRITGDESEYIRQANMDEFQTSRNVSVVLATTAAGGTGITLTASNVMVRLQRDWNAINNAQAEDRIHRIGSEIHKEVRIIDLITPDTIEEQQLDVLSGKYGNLQELLRDKATMAKLLAGKLK
jgi:SNF2 family DNA or RNA helicase